MRLLPITLDSRSNGKGDARYFAFDLKPDFRLFAPDY